MDETVNEPAIFEESDFAADQTEEKASPAVEESTEQTTSQEQTVEAQDDSTNNANESQTGDEIEKFLANKGIKLDDPDALRKVASMYQNVEREFGKKSQEKAQLERQIAESARPAIDRNDPMARIQALESQLAADRQVQLTKEWKAAKNLTPEAEAKMVDFLKQPLVANGIQQKDPQGNPLTKYFLVQSGAISLDDVYTLSGGESIKADVIKQEYKQAVAKEIAAKQAPKSPSALATNSAQFEKAHTTDDDFLDGLLGK